MLKSGLIYLIKGLMMVFFVSAALISLPVMFVCLAVAVIISIILVLLEFTIRIALWLPAYAFFKKDVFMSKYYTDCLRPIINFI